MSGGAGRRISRSPSPSATRAPFRPQALSRRALRAGACASADGSKSGAAPGWRRRVPSKSRSRNDPEKWGPVFGKDHCATKMTTEAAEVVTLPLRASGCPARRLVARALLALLVAAVLWGGADTGRGGRTRVSVPEPPKAADVAQPTQREHARI